MSLSETYARIRPGIVAFAPKYPERIKPGSMPYEFVFGTGFIVGDSLIATNAHVIDVFEQLKLPDGSSNVVAILFIQLPQGMATPAATVLGFTKITTVISPVYHYGPPNADLALVVVGCRGMSRFAMQLHADNVEEGTDIATAGFPMGPELLHLEGRLDHLAPTLQRGIVSAVLPFPGSKPHGYLANIMVQGGASGSPVFLPENGEVIGAIYASRLDRMRVDLPFPKPIHFQVPVNFSHVVPSYFLEKLISEAGSHLTKGVPADAPNIDDMLQSLPPEITQPLLRGIFPQEPKASGE